MQSESLGLQRLVATRALIEGIERDGDGRIGINQTGVGRHGRPNRGLNKDGQTSC